MKINKTLLALWLIGTVLSYIYIFLDPRIEPNTFWFCLLYFPFLNWVILAPGDIEIIIEYKDGKFYCSRGSYRVKTIIRDYDNNTSEMKLYKEIKLDD